MSIKSLFSVSLGSALLFAGVAAQAQVSPSLNPPGVTVSGTPGAVAGSGVYKAGNVAALVSPAHEIPGALVNSTVPTAQPFTASVTVGLATIANGVRGTGANTSGRGLTVYPAGATNGAALSTQAAKNLVTIAPGAVK